MLKIRVTVGEKMLLYGCSGKRLWAQGATNDQARLRLWKALGVKGILILDIPLLCIGYLAIIHEHEEAF